MPVIRFQLIKVDERFGGDLAGFGWSLGTLGYHVDDFRHCVDIFD
jgi:hypothetical protein